MISSEAMDVLIGTPVDQEAELAGLQSLVDSGQAWMLEGSVGRACMAAIEDGAIVLGPTAVRNFYGNRIPSRFEVRHDTTGGITFAHDRHRGELGHDSGIAASCRKCRTLRPPKPQGGELFVEES